MATSLLKSKEEVELGFHLNLPIIVEKQLIALKSREIGADLNRPKVQRLQIIQEIIDSYFEPLLPLLTQSQYSVVFQYLQNAIQVACNNAQLDAPLDYEQYELNDTMKLTKECLELIALSKQIEIVRAKIIATHFVFENMPDIVSTFLEKHHHKDAYIAKYELLVANIVQTVKQIRANKKVLEEFVTTLHNAPTDESEYIKLEFFLKHKVFPCSTEEKSKYTWDRCEKLLVEKIAQALILIDENRKKKNCKTLINYNFVSESSFLNDPRLYIKAKYHDILLDSLRKELLPSMGKDFYKELHHKIKEYKTDRMMDLLLDWLEQPALGQRLSH